MCTRSNSPAASPAMGKTGGAGATSLWSRPVARKLPPPQRVNQWGGNMTAQAGDSCPCRDMRDCSFVGVGCGTAAPSWVYKPVKHRAAPARRPCFGTWARHTAQPERRQEMAGHVCSSWQKLRALPADKVLQWIPGGQGNLLCKHSIKAMRRE